MSAVPTLANPHRIKANHRRRRRCASRVWFPGQYYDAETGLVSNGFRDCYEPATGRYCEPDPIGQAAGPSLYTYVGNNPLNYVDPSGLQVAAGAELGGEIGSFIEPGLGSAAGGVLGGIIGTGVMVYEICHKNDKSCPPCKPPVGTIGYRLDKVPPSVPHYPFTGDHVHLYKMNQNPNNCQYFWQPVGVTNPPLPPGAIPM